MPNLSVNISGSGAIVADSIAVAGDAVVGGRATAAGFTSSIAGTAGTPAYNWSADPDNGPYYSGVANRCEWASGGTDTVSLRSNLIVNYRALTQDGNLTMSTGRKLILDNSGTPTDLPLQFNGDPNTGIGWDSADYMRMYSGGTFAFGLVAGTPRSITAHTFDSTATFNGVATFAKASVHSILGVDIDNVADTISPTGNNYGTIAITLSAGSISSTAAPLIADGTNGQTLTLIRSTDAGNFTISDQATLANSNLRLSTSTFAMGSRDSITLRFINGDWHELYRTNAL